VPNWSSRLGLHRLTLASAAALGAVASHVLALPGVLSAGQSLQKAMYVTVVDKDGAPVPDVKPDDLIVREDGTAREVLRVEPATESMQLAVLVDNSQAATASIQFFRDALGPFVDAITAKGNTVSLITLGDRPTLVVDATKDATVLRKKGVERLFAQPGSGMYLLEAIMEATRGFTKNETKRPVLLAIITEGVEFSNQSYKVVIDALKKSGTSLYALVLTEGAEANPQSDEVRNRNVVLDAGTRETGGRREILITHMSLDSALKKLAAELLNQQQVTYASPERLIPPEKITVESKRKDVTARGIAVKAPPR